MFHRDQMGLSDNRTTLFANFNLYNLIQHFNMNMVKKWTYIPPVSVLNIFQGFWKSKKSQNSHAYFYVYICSRAFGYMILCTFFQPLRKSYSSMLPFFGFFEVFLQQIPMFEDSILMKNKRTVIFEGSTEIYFESLTSLRMMSAPFQMKLKHNICILDFLLHLYG